jgi:4-hydroxy-tetrahydrodipicolinate synthase
VAKSVLAGVFAASITPLNSDFSVDLEALPLFLGFLAWRGCHGALVLGTTGEGPSFSPDERADIWRAALRVRETYPQFRLLAGTGTPSLTETINLTRLAFDLGYDAVVTLPPYYFRNASEDGLYDWFKRVIAQAVPSDGLLLGYHFPAVAGVGFSLQLLSRLKETFPDQFAGLKDSSHDRDFGRALAEKFGTDLAVFSGTDSDFWWALQNHAAGCITAPANILSPDLRQLYDACRLGADVSEIQSRITRQRHTLEKYLPFPPTLKALLARLYGQSRWSVRPPLVRLSGRDEEQVLGELSS